jgi:hypothetical protein
MLPEDEANAATFTSPRWLDDTAVPLVSACIGNAPVLPLPDVVGVTTAVVPLNRTTRE